MSVLAKGAPDHGAPAQIGPDHGAPAKGAPAQVAATDGADVSPLARSRARTRRRELRMGLVLGSCVLIVGAASLAEGAYSLSVADLVTTLLGQGSSSENFIVLSLRLRQTAGGHRRAQSRARSHRGHAHHQPG